MSFATDKAALLALLLVVVLMAAGQLLFKSTALSWHAHGSLLTPTVLLRLLVALSVYGVATIAWIWVLQRAPLNLAYPLVALTFVLVPLVARWMFGETVGMRYWIGVGLIVAGIMVAMSARPASP